MRFITFILLFLLPLSLKAQSDFAPVGAFWNYHYTSHTGNYASHETIIVTHDTIIDGAEVKTLVYNSNNYLAMPPEHPPSGKSTAAFGQLVIRNDSVFHKHHPNTSEYYLFLLNPEIGDTIPIDMDFHLPIYAVVDSMSYYVHQGDSLKKWNMTKYCDDTLFGYPALIEKIGLINDSFFWNTENCVIGGGWRNFLCFKSPDITYNEPCDPILVSSVNPGLTESYQLNLFPNPFADQLNILLETEMQDVTIKIYNTKMQLVFTEHYTTLTNQNLDFSFLQSGIYFLSMENNHIIKTQKILKAK